MVPSKYERIFHALFALIALVILIDYAWPGETIEDRVQEVQKERQQYYNAAGNHHYSYKVVTSQHTFLISKEMAQLELLDRPINYAISPLFREINWYRPEAAEAKSTYSLRLASGFALPALFLVALLAIYRFQRRLGQVPMILQILLIGDLILLCT